MSKKEAVPAPAPLANEDVSALTKIVKVVDHQFVLDAYENVRDHDNAQFRADNPEQKAYKKDYNGRRILDSYGRVIEIPFEKYPYNRRKKGTDHLVAHAVNNKYYKSDGIVANSTRMSKYRADLMPCSRSGVSWYAGANAGELRCEAAAVAQGGKTKELHTLGAVRYLTSCSLGHTYDDVVGFIEARRTEYFVELGIDFADMLKAGEDMVKATRHNRAAGIDDQWELPKLRDPKLPPPQAKKVGKTKPTPEPQQPAKAQEVVEEPVTTTEEPVEAQRVGEPATPKGGIFGENPLDVVSARVAKLAGSGVEFRLAKGSLYMGVKTSDGTIYAGRVERTTKPTAHT